MALSEVLGMADCPLRVLNVSDNHFCASTEAMAALADALANNSSLVSQSTRHAATQPVVSRSRH